MTASGAPPGDEAELEQESMWEEPSARPAQHPAVGSPSRLTQGITSTARVQGPAGLVLADVPNRIMALVIDIIVLSVAGFLLAWLFGGLVSQPGALDAPGGELDVAAFLVVLVAATAHQPRLLRRLLDAALGHSGDAPAWPARG